MRKLGEGPRTVTIPSTHRLAGPNMPERLSSGKGLPLAGPASPNCSGNRGRALRAEAARSFPRALRQPSRSHSSRGAAAR